jgi:hypothetical protein
MAFQSPPNRMSLVPSPRKPKRLREIYNKD